MTIKSTEKNKAALTILGNQINLAGKWTATEISLSSLQLDKLLLPQQQQMTINGRELQALDSAGSLILQCLIQRLEKNANTIHFSNFSDEQQSLLALIAREEKKITPPPKPIIHINPLYILGKKAVLGYFELLDFIAFLGESSVNIIKVIMYPQLMQWRSFLNVIDETGFRALPIVAVLSFAIGVVLSYQMGQQLKVYGANSYIVSVLGVAVLQEFAPLITAIIVAGRTSSSFTAQIGTMKLNEEIDAIVTMGLSPINRLALPKLFGLIVALPLLTVWADIFGLVGGMILSKTQLGISYYGFVSQFPKVIMLSTFINGIVKAPVYAMIIAYVGCFQGFQVGFSADSIGRQTTKSVVQSIFLIIIADAIFSVIQTWQNIA